MTTLSEAVLRYLAARTPTDWEKKQVAQYKERIRGILSDEFRLMGFFQSGSFQHGTAITPHADVDYIARIHREDQPSSSTTILNKIRNLLKRELGEAKDVFVARPTVTIRFWGTVPDYEITPAYLARSVDEEQVLSIPVSGGSWRESAPKAHLKFVREIDEKHYGSVRRLARLLKAWKYQHSVPISSFYLEMRAAEYGKNKENFWILYGVRDVVAKLITTELAAMNDPAKLVNRITACSSETDRSSALAKLRTFQRNLNKVLDEDRSGGDWWSYNQGLQSIWGSGFPYCEPDTV